MRLNLNKISVSFGDNEVLKNVDFEVNTKDKVAIVGRNGSGKTTLLKVITGEQEIDFGFHGTIKDKIQKSGKFEIGYLKQIAFDDDSETFENEIMKVYAPIIELKDKISKLEQEIAEGKIQDYITRYEEMLSKYDMMGGYTYLKEYNAAIKKFGFTEKDKRKALAEFSGGQRTKIALIKLLLSKPDLLILDEPTNHLDITSIRWLEEYLASYPKAIIVVSHDRAFLDKFVNIVYEIERHTIKKYIGNYSTFVKTKAFNYEKELKEYKSHIEERARLQAVADRFRYKATKASMAQSKLKQIERMGDVDKPLEADSRVFGGKFEPRVSSSNEVIVADNIEIGYDKVLTKISFKVYRGDRVGVVGGNGLGKSTLLKSLVCKVKLLGGKIKFGSNVEVGYFDQQTATNNIVSESIIDNFLKEFPDEDTQSARTILGSFCFTQDDVFKNIRDLSGGERIRLELCKILRRRPNLLILDEPTNHMDIMGKEALEKMLEGYEGTIIFVSHDRYFVNKIATSLIVFENGGGRYLKDTKYNDYEKSCMETSIKDGELTQRQPLSSKIIDAKPKADSYLISKEKARKEAKLKKLEKKIEQLGNDIQQTQKLMELPENCSDYVKVMEYQSIIDIKNQELESLMTEWMDLSE